MQINVSVGIIFPADTLHVKFHMSLYTIIILVLSVAWKHHKTIIVIINCKTLRRTQLYSYLKEKLKMKIEIKLLASNN